MIFEGKQPNLAEIADRNEAINEHQHTDSRIPCCGHDFWDAFRKAEFGDVVLCGRCQCYYAKIRNLPWICRPKWDGQKYETNHLGDGFAFNGYAWAVFVPARVTD